MPTLTDIRDAIDRALAIPALKSAIVGVGVYAQDRGSGDNSKGKAIYERNIDLSLTPASNLKLLTAIAALVRLGVEFRYPTTLLHTGEIDADGVLRGDLFLRGSGDPSLTSERLLTLAESLRAAGVRKVAGRIVGDGTAFDDKWLGAAWQWDEEAYYFSAQVSGLNCDRNVIAFHVRPGETVGDDALVILGGDDTERLAFARTTYVTVRNTVVTVVATADAAPTIDYNRARARNEFRIAGTIPLGAAPVARRLTVEDPARFTATRFAELCTRAGIETRPARECVKRGVTPTDATSLATTQSAPLRELVRPFLKDSDNLFGEAFLKTLGGGTASAGAKVIAELLASWGLDTTGLYQFDGSGLSRLNGLTPRLLTDLLRHVDHEISPAIRDVFLDALPIAGVDGTLDDRMRGTAAESNVWAKTGSLDNASSMAGYLRTKTGERLIFAILLNHFAVADMSIARRATDAIAVALTDLPSPENH